MNPLAYSIALLLGTPLAPPVPGGEVPLEIMQVTATRQARSNHEVAQPVTVVGLEEIREQTPQTVADLLRGQVGAFVQQTTPGQGNVFIRGLKGSEVLHLVDGFRLNTAIFRNAPNQYLALVDAQNIDHLEVVRGPGSTLYGGDAMGGVLQILTPEQRFEGAQWQARGQTRAILGSADLSSLSRVSASAGREGVSLSAGATYQDIGRRRTGTGERLRDTDFIARHGDFKLLLEPSELHQVMLAFQYGEQPGTPRHDALVPGFGQDNPENTLFYFEPNRRVFSHLRYRSFAATPLWDNVEVHLGRQRTQDDRRNQDFGDDRLNLERNESRLSGFTASAGRSLGSAHALVYGFEFYRDDIASSRLRIAPDGSISTPASRFPDGSRNDSLGVFATDDWALTDRLNLNLGLRYSRIRVDLPPADRGVGVKLDLDDTTGNAGFVYKLDSSWNLVGNVGRGFRAPNVFDLGTLGDRPGNRFNAPNADLKPETVVTADLGLKFLGESVQAEVYAFRSDYRDKITSVLTGELTESGREIVQNQNATEAELWGLEAGGRWYLDENIELFGTLLYTRGEETLAGDTAPANRIPPLGGRLGTLWRFAEDWSVEGWVSYADRQDRLSPSDLSDPRINPEGTAGYATVNTRLKWTPRDDLSINLRLENLTDKSYREHGSGLDAPGRGASISVDWTF